MKHGLFEQNFDAIVSKRLSDVECDPRRSHQHEFNGTLALKQFLGIDRLSFKGAVFEYLDDDEEKTCEGRGDVTWYDARENHPTRSEYRLYFTTNEVMNQAQAGDLLVIRRIGEQLNFIVVREGSTIENQVGWLFGLEGVDRQFELIEAAGKHPSELDCVVEPLRQRLGIEEEIQIDNSLLDGVLKRFPNGFPTTKEFSSYARETFTHESDCDPDIAIMRWTNHELLLFETLERHLVAHRLNDGFNNDVDGFLGFSLSVQNRRKSRAGCAFENHFEQLFVDHGVQYCRGGRTERSSKPDFLFPGQTEYVDKKYPAERLTMLGVKTTCKDRWRQILTEADRIPKKHLATLEASISKPQTDEMKVQGLTLVVPQVIHQTYSKAQQSELITVAAFIDIVLARQKMT